MPRSRSASEIRLVNGSTGDPVLFIDYPGRDDAILFDAGENASLGLDRLGDLGAVFITHHHVDHFIGLDRIVRANLDRDKTLRVFGPSGTIQRVYDRIRSYEYPFFPFQKLIVEVHDLAKGTETVAALDCSRRFPEPEPVATGWEGPTVFRADGLRVEAAFADHSVPCLSYALVEEAGYQPDRERMASGPLKPGRWISQVLEGLRAGESSDAAIDIDGGRYRLGDLAGRYFHRAPEVRVCYITDTAWSEASKPGLLRLAHKAWRLYCDSFYSRKHLKSAEKHRHMTATQAAELAREAKVEALVLIHFAARYAGAYGMLLDEARAIFPGATAEGI